MGNLTFKKSILNKLKKINAVNFIVLSIILSIVVFTVLRTLSYNVTNTLSEMFARNSALTLEEEFENKFGTLSALTKEPLIIDWYKNEFDEDIRNEMLKRIEVHMGDLRAEQFCFVVEDSLNLYLFGEDYSFDPNKEFAPVSVMSRDNEEDEWYYDTIERKQHYNLNADIDKINRLESVWFNFKILDEDGKIIGTFSVDLSVERLANSLFENYDKNGIGGYIIDNKGNVKFCNDLVSDNGTKLYQDLNVVEIFDNQEVDDYINRITNKNEYFSEKDSIQIIKNGKDVISIVPIKDTEWLVVSTVNIDNGVSPLVYIIVIVFFVIVLLLYTVIAQYNIKKLIIDPVQLLAKDVENLAEIDNDDMQLYGSNRDDEIGFLSNSILSLKKSLDDQNKNLKLYTSNIIETMSNGAKIWSKDFKINHVNKALLDLLQCKYDEIINGNDKFYPEYQSNGEKSKELLKHYFNKALEEGFVEFDWEYKNKMGEIIYTREKFVKIKYIEEDIIISYIQDLSELEEVNRYTEQLLECLPFHASFFDQNKNLIYANNTTKKIYGCEPQYYIDNLEKFSPEVQPNGKDSILLLNEYLDKAFEAGEISFDWLDKDIDDKHIPCRITLSRIKYKKDYRIITFLEDKREVEYAAKHDYLTGAYNLIGLREEFDFKVRSESKFGLLQLDIVDFKQINNSYSNFVGDLLLKEVTSRLKGLVENVARMGADDFAFICNGDKEELKSTLNKIIFELSKDFNIDKYNININIQVAVIECKDEFIDFDYNLSYLESTLLEIKKNSVKNYSFVDDKIKEIITKHNNIKVITSKAIENNEFFTVFQPEVDINTNRIVGFETLLRLNNKKVGFISPVDFIPVIEETGAIIEVGYFVIESAVKFIKEILDKGIDIEFISVNVSLIQLLQVDFLENVLKILNKYKIPFNKLQIEMTESVFANDLVSLVNILQSFRDEGITVALDDFGTSYSSFSYILNLPIDVIKIDRSFIDKVHEKEKQQMILKSIIFTSQSLNCKTVAEGIELEEEKAFLKKSKCDILQGYLFSKPLMPKKALELLEENNA